MNATDHIVSESQALIGQLAPPFRLAATRFGDPQKSTVDSVDFLGQWLMLMFYPRDFSFVCPTELTAFSGRSDDFLQRQCRILAISVDTIDSHRRWLTAPLDQGGIGPLRFPLVSDPKGELARRYGVLDLEREVAQRGLFLIDPEGRLQYAVKHNLSVGRNPDEVLRVLDALQTGGLCPASWTTADGTIDPEQALQPGRVLGHYRIDQQLGSGSFGVVYAAWDLKLERPVAIKVLRRGLQESRAALLSEARAAAALNHPAICTIYAVEEEDGLPIVAMEMVDGDPLSKHIGRLTPLQALEILSQLASALAAAHEAGVVHGDLKPANILLTSEGRPKILDFGLARSQHPLSLQDPTGPSQIAAMTHNNPQLPDIAATVDFLSADKAASLRGTPAYMAPEQLLAGMPANAPSDVFSLGLLTYEMLRGKRALPESNVSDLMRTLEHPNLGDLLTSELPPRWQGPLKSLFGSALCRDQQQRPSMRELAEAADQLRAQASDWSVPA